MQKSLHYKKNLQLFILALPALLVILVFNYLPMAGIFIAFKNINFRDGILGSPWVGFENFKFFFTSSDAWVVTRNTLAYNLSFIIIGTLAALLFAILLNEIASRTMLKVYQTVFFFPYFFSWVIVSYMVYAFFAPTGVFVGFLAQHGINITDFYTNAKYWPIFIPLLFIWKGLGYQSIIYYAGILGISSEYYEAASIDGATGIQSVRYITLPLLAPLISTLTLLALGKIFYSDFGLFYFVPREVGALFPTTQVIDTYVFRMLKTSGDIGLAAASSLYQSIVGFVLVIVSNYIVGRFDKENTIF